ncbi:MAG: DUF2470 domain-containing protein [Mycolicibacterium insubricum]
MRGVLVTQATTAAPTTAERIRSACLRAGSALLALDGADPETASVHHLLADGSFAVTVPAHGVAALTAATAVGPRGANDGVQAVLELTDYAPLPLREPVRSLVWIRGVLRPVPASETPALLDLIASEDPNPALLQVGDSDVVLLLEADSVVVADADGAESVGIGALLAARPDPFCAMESGWLRHLDAAHSDVIDRLAARLPSTLRQGRVRPLGLDRYGMRLRVESESGDHDIRLAFPAPVDDIAGLSKAIRILMGCPFVNGLRPRSS